MAVLVPKWDIQKKGDCRKILDAGIAEGLTEFKMQVPDNTEVEENN